MADEFLLKEDGDKLLLEDGASRVLLDAGGGHRHWSFQVFTIKQKPAQRLAQTD